MEKTGEVGFVWIRRLYNKILDILYVKPISVPHWLRTWLFSCRLFFKTFMHIRIIQKLRGYPKYIRSYEKRLSRSMHETNNKIARNLYAFETRQCGNFINVFLVGEGCYYTWNNDFRQYGESLKWKGKYQKWIFIYILSSITNYIGGEVSMLACCRELCHYHNKAKFQWSLKIMYLKWKIYVIEWNGRFTIIWKSCIKAFSSDVFPKTKYSLLIIVRKQFAVSDITMKLTKKKIISI